MGKTIHMIANAHLDPVWQWRLLEGQAEVLATFKSAVDRLKEKKELVFTCSSAAYYQWVEKLDSSLFEEIKRFVQEKRWIPVGGWLVQADCNLPCGESFARQALYAQRYYYNTFGIICETGYSVDAFGHNGMLPQILLLSGMNQYVFMRPHLNEKAQIPGNVFWWEGIDGSKVLTYRIPGTYCVSDMETMQQYVSGAYEATQKYNFDTMCFYGIGNHGGGPSKMQIQYIEEHVSQEGDVNLSFSSVDTFFNKIRNENHHLETWKGDLQHHASGCYSAHSELKRLNRKCENQLVYAEKFNTIASLIFDLNTDTAEFQKLWYNVNFNQFHDIICGCSIKDACDDAIQAYGSALAGSQHILNQSLLKISWSIDTWIEGVGDISRIRPYDWKQTDIPLPIVVFNSLSWEVVAPVRLGSVFKNVKNSRGEVTVSQTIRSYRSNVADTKDTMFYATVPPMGYATYWADLEDTNQTVQNKLIVTQTSLENAFIKISFDPKTGTICDWFDKCNGINLLLNHSSNPIVIDDEASDTWGHAVNYFNCKRGEFSPIEMKVIEQGPLRASIRIKSKYRKSYMTQTFMLYYDKPYLEVYVKVNWFEKHDMLKFGFSLNAKNCVGEYEIPYGTISRPANGEEESAQAFADCTGTYQNQKVGVTIFTDSKYSYSIDENEIRFTAIRNAIYCDHMMKERDDHDFDYLDEGVSYFTYIIKPHVGEFNKADAVHLAQELHNRPIAIFETYHKGNLPQVASYFSVSKDNIVISAFKRAEDNDGYILRCYETAGIMTDAVIQSHIQALPVAIHATFKNNEIKTFKLRNDNFVETNFLEFE